MGRTGAARKPPSVTPMTTVPRWGVLSALLAPLLLVGGWSVGAALRPDGYDPVRRTISDLAAVGAPHRWVMTFALLGVGFCHIVTAAALRPVAVPGRAVLALGGVATLLVAANPLPAAGSSGAHTAAASVAFGALACWPLLAWRRDGRAGGVLGTAPRLAAAVVLLGTLAWFVLDLGTGTGGLAERCAAALQALWPLVVVLLLRRDSAPRRRA
jgi:hypothetical membrane protein